MSMLIFQSSDFLKYLFSMLQRNLLWTERAAVRRGKRIEELEYLAQLEKSLR